MGKNKKNKNKSIKVSKRTINIFCALVALAVVIGGIGVFIGLDGKTLFSNGDITLAALQSNSTLAMSKYDYALMTLTIEEAVTGEESKTQQYILSSHRNAHDRAYVYVDSLGVSLYQYWEQNGESYDLYVYDNSLEVWVKTSLDYEPVTNDPWSMLSDLGDYSLLDGTQTWYYSDDECYVLEMVGASNEYSNMYEQLFIRKSDFIPIGIVSYASAGTGETTSVDEDTEMDINDDGIEESVHVEEVEVRKEIMNVYELAFSTSDLKMFGIPEEFVSEEEYMDLLNAGGTSNE